jgi:hypothetical protein
MFRTIRWLSIVVISGVLLVTSGDAHAQQTGKVHAPSPVTGSIWGTVSQHGAPLGGAKVTLVSEETKESLGASTDGTGEYRFEDLKPGTYDLTFDASGLVPKAQRVKVKAGRKMNVSEHLKPPAEPETPSK